MRGARSDAASDAPPKQSPGSGPAKRTAVDGKAESDRRDFEPADSPVSGEATGPVAAHSLLLLCLQFEFDPARFGVLQEAF